MASLGDIQGQIQAAQTPIEEAQAQANAVKESSINAAGQLGGVHSEAGELTEQLNMIGVSDTAQQMQGVTERLEQLQQRCTAIGEEQEKLSSELGGIKAETDELLTIVAGLQGLMAAPGAPARGSPAQPTSKSWPGNYKVSDFIPARPVAECVDKIRRVGWPQNERGNTSARGILYAPDGTQITGVLQAGTKGPAATSTDLKSPWSDHPKMTLRWHVEGHVAAHMRQNSVQETVLYLNLPPCGQSGTDPYRCDPNVDKVLPEGSKLTVWAVQDGHKMPRKFVYRGTGEAIKNDN